MNKKRPEKTGRNSAVSDVQAAFLFRVSELASDNVDAVKLAQLVVGAAGFEPTNAGVKVLCLTAWLYPKNSLKYYNKKTDINQVLGIFIFVLTWASPYCQSTDNRRFRS